jgi:acyl-CoA dehydrogenase
MTVLDRLTAAIPLSETESLLVDSVRSLAREVIAPNAQRLDDTGEFPWDNIKAINQIGLNAMYIPEQYGGAGLSYTAYLACVRELSAACASTGMVWATTFHAMKPLVEFGNEEQKSRLLPRIAAGGLGALAITEPQAGSDATAMTTRFRPDGDSIIVDGAKTFITNGDVADLYLLFGKWSEIDDPKDAISVLVFEKGTPGFPCSAPSGRWGTAPPAPRRSRSTAAACRGPT